MNPGVSQPTEKKNKSIIHPPGWKILKRLTLFDFQEYVEQPEFTYIIGESVKWHNYFRKSSGSFLEN